MNQPPRSFMGSFLRLSIPIILKGIILFHPNLVVAVQTIPDFAGEKSSWHGFDRYDFIPGTTALAITPFKSVGEGDGVRDPKEGQRRCIVVVPKKAAAGNPWSWRGCYWNHQLQAEIDLLKRGFCIAYISAN